MKILVIGSGGREHALVWKISQSPKAQKIYCAPGSAAIGELAEQVPIAPDEITKLADFAAKEGIALEPREGAAAAPAVEAPAAKLGPQAQ